jgi:GntR family transcriptional regulator
VAARLPTTEELETLELPIDVPVLRQFGVVYSATRAVEAAILIKGAHRYEVQYRETISDEENPVS